MSEATLLQGGQVPERNNQQTAKRIKQSYQQRRAADRLL